MHESFEKGAKSDLRVGPSWVDASINYRVGFTDKHRSRKRLALFFNPKDERTAETCGAHASRTFRPRRHAGVDLKGQRRVMPIIIRRVAGGRTSFAFNHSGANNNTQRNDNIRVKLIILYVQLRERKQLAFPRALILFPSSQRHT